MKMMLMKFMMLISTLTILMYNPMVMGLMLMIQTVIMVMIMSKMMTSSWFGMITFLMMIGGLLILIMYMVSIASNEKFNVKINLTFMMILILMINEELMNESQIDEIQSMVMIMTSEQLSMIKLYNKSSMLMSIMLVMYLFMTMIAVTKIVKHYKGPLRSKN